VKINIATDSLDVWSLLWLYYYCC